MKNILVIGAGLSSTYLIEYLLEHSESENWFVRVGDTNLELAQEKVNNSDFGTAFLFDALNKEERIKEIAKADLVISMLPAIFHIEVAKDCVNLKKNLITPSYISDEIKELDQIARENGVLLMNEIGLDPGIDHMSAKKVLDEIQNLGGEIKLFESFTGGLIAPESDNNPWHYKFTWNPRNVVVAGQGGVAKFIQEGKYKYIPYNKLFRRTEFIDIDGLGSFEGYANRDSLKYRDIYGLHNIPTLYRGTLRRKGFSRAWDMFIQIGMTDDSYILEGSENMTKREFVNSFLPFNTHDSVEIKLKQYLHIDQDDFLWDKLVWLGLFENEPININEDSSPAKILQSILEEKWSIQPEDKDMIVMWHKFGFEKNGERKEICSTMVCTGENAKRTAMAKTVGLPIAICAKLVLNNKIQLNGVQLPILPEVYNPILTELEELGITFTEKESEPTIYS